MRDSARSDHPGVQRQLDRLAALSLPEGRLGLETMRALLERLGDPHRALPPVFHVAGTNGKGSTCAFLRAMLEAQGYRVHATTSPHLVRYNERIRLAGQLIEDGALAEVLAEVLDAAENLAVSFFEVTIAAAFLEFARVPADACIVEVGLGGRLDATNVIDRPAVCGIASLGIDHERFLLAPEDGVPQEPIVRIAYEKAGIAKPGVPLVVQAPPAPAVSEIERIAGETGSPLYMEGRHWDAADHQQMMFYADKTHRNGVDILHLPLPVLPGRHQFANAGLAIAMLRHQDGLFVTSEAIAAGLHAARWPARLQRLSTGGPIGRGREVWLDGGHNLDAGAMLARHFAGRRLHLVIGMIAGKDPAAIVGSLKESIASSIAVPVPGHDCHPASAFGPRVAAAASVPEALASLPPDGLPVLIAGSLYLAGEVLRLNGEVPT